jgi:hypothetical protein
MLGMTTAQRPGEAPPISEFRAITRPTAGNIAARVPDAVREFVSLVVRGGG